MSDVVRIGLAYKHMWEEPCISGEKGSGAVFFCGCNLKCVYCQNYEISRGHVGKNISVDELAKEMLRLQDEEAHNINLVTAGHFIEPVIKAIKLARKQGLSIPIVYNTSAYEPVENIKKLEGTVDIYLPDLKYVSSQMSERYSKCPDYFSVASKAIAEMVRQTGECSFDKEGIMERGTIVRHMMLPGCIEDSKAVVKYLIENFGEKIFVSIMNQYTPMEQVKDKYPEIYCKVSEDEYEELLDYAIDLGLENGFYQEGDVAEESFIPDWGRS